MKRREVGRDYTKRIEFDLEHGRTGSVKTLLENHWSTETDPLRIAAEATVWLRDRGLPDMLTKDCSLCERLRSVHRVKHDSLDDLAGRIIDLVVDLEVIEGLEWAGRGGSKYWFAAGVAVEIGKVHALFCIYRQLDETRKKPRIPSVVWDELAKSLGGAPSRSEAWSIIHEGEDDEPSIEAAGFMWCVYRVGDLLYAVNDQTGVKHSITRERFFKKYLKRYIPFQTK